MVWNFDAQRRRLWFHSASYCHPYQNDESVEFGTVKHRWFTGRARGVVAFGTVLCPANVFGTMFGTVKHRSLQVKRERGRTSKQAKKPENPCGKRKTRTVANGTGLVFGAISARLPLRHPPVHTRPPARPAVRRHFVGCAFLPMSNGLGLRMNTLAPCTVIHFVGSHSSSTSPTVNA